MAIPLQISYRDVRQSGALDELITHEAEKLERFFPRIISCRVLIEHRRHRSGAPFNARIVLNVPGQEIVINQAGDVHEMLQGDDETAARVQKRADIDAAYKDPVLAVRSAFKKAKRQLQDYVRLKAS